MHGIGFDVTCVCVCVSHMSLILNGKFVLKVTRNCNVSMCTNFIKQTFKFDFVFFSGTTTTTTNEIANQRKNCIFVLQRWKLVCSADTEKRRLAHTQSILYVFCWPRIAKIQIKYLYTFATWWEYGLTRARSLVYTCLACGYYHHKSNCI